MNPQFDPTPGLRLPQPTTNPAAISPTPAPQAAPTMPALTPAAAPIQQAPEMAPAAPVTPAPVQPEVLGTVSPVSQQAVPAPAQVQATTEQVTPSAVAEADEDAQDEEWVNKAKSTIEQYKGDPYAQSKALSRLKAEYMQVRHGKTLKVSE